MEALAPDEPTPPGADLTTFARLDELGLEVVGQRLDPDRAVLACSYAPVYKPVLHRPVGLAQFSSTRAGRCSSGSRRPTSPSHHQKTSTPTRAAPLPIAPRVRGQFPGDRGLSFGMDVRRLALDARWPRSGQSETPGSTWFRTSSGTRASRG